MYRVLVFILLIVNQIAFAQNVLKKESVLIDIINKLSNNKKSIDYICIDMEHNQLEFNFGHINRLSFIDRSNFDSLSLSIIKSNYIDTNKKIIDFNKSYYSYAGYNEIPYVIPLEDRYKNYDFNIIIIGSPLTFGWDILETFNFRAFSFLIAKVDEVVTEEMRIPILIYKVKNQISTFDYFIANVYLKMNQDYNSLYKIKIRKLK